MDDEYGLRFTNDHSCTRTSVHYKKEVERTKAFLAALIADVGKGTPLVKVCNHAKTGAKPPWSFKASREGGKPAWSFDYTNVIGLGGGSLAAQAAALMQRKAELLSDPERHKEPVPTKRVKAGVLARRAVAGAVVSGLGTKRSTSTVNREFLKDTHMGKHVVATPA